MKIQKIAPVVCLALSSLVASNANANTVSFSTPDVFFSFTGLNGPSFFLDGTDVPFQASFGLGSLPQFDASLGTLTGASISITGDLTVN
ncbi:MAG TPA: choice-of-anchor E domain-containing protein, partial [Gammaproteobacteria bacterium]|nr:choice-of-anchor E domain-containing protein [Gammaproteobacteria bacterium]